MKAFLNELGIKESNPGATTGAGWIETAGPELVSYSPIDGQAIATVKQATTADYETVMAKATAAFKDWRMKPAPLRGQVVQAIGNRLREHKAALGRLVSIEMGKSLEEGLGEVQEMIDIADFAVGLSRQLYGLTMHSERPRHRMYEQWHPLGAVGVISAFNFPVAVWSWNALIAAVCGDVVVWKPSSQTPLTALAVQHLIAPVVDEFGIDGVFNLVIGSGKEVGEKLINDKRIPLVSATGSCRMGRHIGQAVAQRLGRSLLELGGNNAVIIAPDANLDMALRGVVFGAIGTAGQRCTSTRRVIVHKSIKERFVAMLQDAYGQLKIGDPTAPGVHMGPLVNAPAVEEMMKALEAAAQQGATLRHGGTRLTIPGLEGGYYVTPAIVEATNNLPIVQEETFAPILYVLEYEDFDEAIRLQNDVPQGLSSALFTESFRTSERFLSHGGSDCGIANVNLGTSGAEIGGAFGGEKETGGGRESGSDAWKQYMRRQTNTLNWGDTLPLAQGIQFHLS